MEDLKSSLDDLISEWHNVPRPICNAIRLLKNALIFLLDTTTDIKTSNTSSELDLLSKYASIQEQLYNDNEELIKSEERTQKLIKSSTAEMKTIIQGIEKQLTSEFEIEKKKLNAKIASAINLAELCTKKIEAMPRPHETERLIQVTLLKTKSEIIHELKEKTIKNELEYLTKRINSVET